MIIQELNIKGYDWHVTFFFSVTCYHLYTILDKLREIGASQDVVAKAYKNISSCSLDTGLTYSNPERRESVVVIGTASSPEEYSNSIAHECQHLIKHIGLENGIDPYSEELCYLAGHIAGEIHKNASALFCNNCLMGLRKKLSCTRR